MKGAFVCHAACELFSLFIRLFYQDGKTPRGLWLGSGPGWGWRETTGGESGSERKKKSHWCQLAALSRSGAKLKAKDSSRIGRGEKRRKLPEPVEVTENDHGFKPAICSAVLPVRVKFPQFVREKLLGKSFVTQKAAILFSLVMDQSTATSAPRSARSDSSPLRRQVNAVIELN